MMFLPGTGFFSIGRLRSNEAALFVRFHSGVLLARRKRNRG
jgi:hypothetical protein